MDKQKADSEKVLNYGPHLKKEDAQKFGIDITQGKQPVEEMTEKERFTIPTSAADLGVSKPISQEEEFMRWTTNKSLSVDMINKIIKYLKKNKLDIKDSETWNPALEKVNEMPEEDSLPIVEEVIVKPEVKQYDLKAIAKICLKISDDFLQLADLLKDM